MSLRAVIAGLLFGLGVSAVVYFNDFVIRQGPLVNHLLPVIILGTVLLILLAINPLLNRLSGRGLGTGEVAVIAAIGLAACSFPEAGFYRTGPTNVAMPAYQYLTRPNWKAHHVLAYVPGHAGTLGEGHVQDWSALGRRLTQAGEQAPGSVLGLLWDELHPSAQLEFQRLAEGAQVGPQQRRTLIRALNQSMEHAALYGADDLMRLGLSASLVARVEAMRSDEPSPHEQRAMNRTLLVAALPGVVLPAPAGDGALLLGGRWDAEVSDPLILGGEPLGMADLPWGAWWPSVRLWGGSMLLIGLATLCMTVIVHPQWSRNELLPYPIARFVNDVIRRQPGRYLPDVTAHRLFWWGFGAMLAMHLLNGLGVWLPDAGLPRIPRWFDFNAVRVLFPGASRVYGSEAYFTPEISFAIIAFAFFLPTRVSLSLGVAPLMFVLLGVFMLGFGTKLEADYLAAGSSNMLRFGGYVGMALMIAYTGRRYYSHVLAGAVGLKTAASTPRSAVWAARGLALAVLGATAVLTTGGLHWSFAMAVVLLVLLAMLVLARIVAETGMFFIQTFWMPVAVLTAFMGFEAIGPTTYIVLALASTMLIGDPRAAIMANLVNAFQIVDRAGERPNKVAPWMLVMIVAGFLVAGVATLYVAYNFGGFAGTDGWTRETLPALPFDQLAGYLAEASSTGQVAAGTSMEPWQRWLSIEPDAMLMVWGGVGAALVLVTAAARLHLPWWPLHPVVFLVWGTYGSNRFAFSFLLGWALKGAVTHLGGIRGYRALIPLTVGVIAGEVGASFFWLGVGTIYYLVTGMNTSWYTVF